ncbi:chemotaxis protein CheW [Sphingomonas sp. 1P06PA]|uniref:chemotaxis protein CheW n=1 Tax=Sphingomonas sp. 1P06PA TaxID=554121 RepID=UPI0039A44A6A
MDALPATLLVFRIGEARFAIDAGRVRDIVPMLPLWRPPSLPAPLAGFVSIAGGILPVLDPAILFGAPPRKAAGLFAHIIRPHGAGAQMPCLLVDRVEDVRSAEPAAIAPVSPEHSQGGAVIGEVSLEDGIAHLLSLDRLLADAERARIADLTDDALRRAADWAIPV